MSKYEVIDQKDTLVDCLLVQINIFIYLLSCEEKFYL